MLNNYTVNVLPYVKESSGDECKDLHATNVASKHRLDRFGSRSRKKRMTSVPEKPRRCENSNNLQVYCARGCYYYYYTTPHHCA
ncbi:hypothetical protein CEXT_317721 [Caerostris extrusa]|uniref:Uncharacterized protein n=1 Tax=Caerostris extrusa TaxID=172846 RepID=A0AAV4MYL0_CAEEX|nr:hypothetical protein CEXT_317721 [Caerostris extrusa]